MTWDTTAIFGVASALLGVALGLFGDRWLRYRGDVHCQIERLGEVDPDRTRSGPAPYKVRQSVQAHFFNNKEVDTGLSSITVVFVFEDGEVALGPETRGYETSTSPLGVINLPSKTWVSVRIQGDFYGPQVKPILTDLKAVKIKGKFPDSTLYNKKILIEGAGGDVPWEPEPRP